MVASKFMSKNAKQVLEPSRQSIFLQLLVYLLWAVVTLLFGVVAHAVIRYFFASSYVGEFSAYIIAASVGMLVLAIACELFYERSEIYAKKGLALFIQKSSAIFFFVICLGMFGYGALELIFIEDMLRLPLIIALFITAFLYILLCIRVKNPKKKFNVARWYLFVVTFVVSLFVAAGLFGPFSYALLTRADIQMENEILDIDSQIKEYAIMHNELPPTLNSITLSETGANFAKQGLITYTPKDNPSPLPQERHALFVEIFNYTLCATFEQQDKTGERKYETNEGREYNLYSPSVAVPGHPAGKVCYDQQASETRSVM